jgi:hypothetical protein
MRARLLRTLAASGAIGLASIGLVAAVGGSSAPAQTESNGNVTTCAQVGFPNDTQTTGDSNVDITASGSSITVSIVGSGVVIDAVVVKGGPNANIYSPGGEGTFTTPINPANGQPYGLSHYFVCYHIEEVTTTAPPETPTTAATPTTAGAAATVTPQGPQVAAQSAQQPAPAGVRVQPRVTG